MIKRRKRVGIQTDFLQNPIQTESQLPCRYRPLAARADYDQVILPTKELGALLHTLTQAESARMAPRCVRRASSQGGSAGVGVP